MDPAQEERRARLRALPPVGEALEWPELAALGARVGRERLAQLLRAALAEWREEILGDEGVPPPAPSEPRARLADRVAELERDDRARSLQRAINATGVVLHTGLGRAPLHPEVARAMAEAAGSYCTLELERESGERGERDARLGELCVRLVGGEAAIALNNNAGAVLLVLSTFAAGREAVVSRGELVEIGGSFRIPDVMQRAGVELREVGTTNRTRLCDFEDAISARTGLLMKVHWSNFRIVGFTEEVPASELAQLARARGLASAWDLGSGLVDAPGARPLDFLRGETSVRDALASGVDLVCFSGDKLLGGPQAGLVVGRAQAVRALRRNPIYRALRLDKVSLAGLERTVELYLAGRADELPARRMLLASASDLEPIARRIAARVAELPGLRARACPERSQPGSGSAPDVFLDTWAVAVAHARRSAGALARALRLCDPPIFCRVREDELLIDPRTLLEGEEELLLLALRGLSAGADQRTG